MARPVRDSPDGAALVRAQVWRDAAAADVETSIARVRLALVKARLDDAIILIKQWDRATAAHWPCP